MKKILVYMLAAALLLALCACGGTGGAAAETAKATPVTTAGGAAQPAEPEGATLMMGYGKVDITPEESVPMNEGGQGSDGMSGGILDYLYATCIYLVDSNGTELYLLAFDLCNMYDPLPEYRLELAEKLGVTESQLMFSASHTHSSVNIKATHVTATVQYNAKLKKDLEKAALQAKDDAKEVTGMYYASIETESLNFVRRYIMNDGTYAGDNYGDSSSGYAAHESEGDSQLQLVKFTREGGKDVVLTNFQTHPHRTAYYDNKNNINISADIVGIYRELLAQQLDCYALYYTGSSGNVNAHSRIAEENVYATYRDHAEAMVEYAVKAAAGFTQLELGPILLRKTVYIGQSYLSENYKLPQARIVAERFNSGMSNKEALAGYEDLFEHSRHAIAIVGRANWSETQEVPLYSFSVGEFAACYAPFELFAELGVMIKESSPFPATFVCCYSNDIFSYMPTSEAFEIGGYGPYKCNFEPGTGELIVEEFVQQLNGMCGQ